MNQQLTNICAKSKYLVRTAFRNFRILSAAYFYISSINIFLIQAFNYRILCFLFRDMLITNFVPYYFDSNFFQRTDEKCQKIISFQLSLKGVNFSSILISFDLVISPVNKLLQSGSRNTDDDELSMAHSGSIYEVQLISNTIANNISFYGGNSITCVNLEKFLLKKENLQSIVQY